MSLNGLSLFALVLTMFVFLECGCRVKQVNETGTPDRLNDIHKSANFNPQKTYGSLSLVYKGKPIFKPGQKVGSLDEILSFQSDSNGDYSDLPNLVTDYYRSDPGLSVSLNAGSINGILFFSAGKDKGEIFSISGAWVIDADLNNKKIKQEVIKAITKNLFPTLTDKIELNPDWSYTKERASITEHFKIMSPGRAGSYWKLYYEVKTKE